MLTAYVHSKHIRPDGSFDTFRTVTCEVKESPLAWQIAGLTYTATGYGSRIPTRYMVRFNDKWRRVYCRIYSNIGTCFIGKLASSGEIHNVDICEA